VNLESGSPIWHPAHLKYVAETTELSTLRGDHYGADYEDALGELRAQIPNRTR